MLEILKDLESGMKQMAVARKYGIAQSMVSKINIGGRSFIDARAERRYRLENPLACAYASCDRVAYCRGYCSTHYNQ